MSAPPISRPQYACNETVVNYLEAALNQILIYRDCFEINLQSEVKRGAEGTVRGATGVISRGGHQEWCMQWPLMRTMGEGR